MSKRDVGYLGEDTLALWVSQLGIVSNPVRRDRRGWDNLLEFPVDWSSTRGGARDTMRGPTKCLVQVKSTDRRVSGFRVSLTNLQHFVTSPLPAFFLVLEFDGKSAPERASLIHVDRQIAYRVLERLRRVSMEPGKWARSKELETVSIATGDRLPTADATSLAAAIHNHVGPDLDAYCALKREWIATVGYEKGSKQVDLKVRLPLDGRSSQEVLIDFALGIEPQLEVLGGDVWDFRFGVPSPIPLETIPSGQHIQVVRKPIARGQLILRSPLGRKASLSGDVYGPVGFGTLLDYNNLKVRFESQFVDLSLVLGKAGANNLNIRLPGSGEMCPIDELGRFSDAILIAAQVAVPDEVEFELRFWDQLWGSGTLVGHEPFDDDAVDRASVGSHAWGVARTFDLSPSSGVDIDQLLTQKRELKLAHGMLCEDPDVTSIEVTFDTEPDPHREVCVPIAFPVQIGESICIVAGAILGVPLPGKGGKHFTLGKRRWRRHGRMVIQVGQRAPKSRVQILEDIARLLADGGEVLRWWDRPGDPTKGSPAVTTT